MKEYVQALLISCSIVIDVLIQVNNNSLCFPRVNRERVTSYQRTKNLSSVTLAGDLSDVIKQLTPSILLWCSFVLFLLILHFRLKFPLEQNIFFNYVDEF